MRRPNHETLPLCRRVMRSARSYQRSRWPLARAAAVGRRETGRNVPLRGLLRPCIADRRLARSSASPTATPGAGRRPPGRASVRHGPRNGQSARAHRPVARRYESTKRTSVPEHDPARGTGRARPAAPASASAMASPFAWHQPSDLNHPGGSGLVPRPGGADPTDDAGDESPGPRHRDAARRRRWRYSTTDPGTCPARYFDRAASTDPAAANAGGWNRHPAPGAGGGGIQRPALRPAPVRAAVASSDPELRPSRPGAGGGGIQRPELRPSRPGEGGGGIQRPELRPSRAR